MSMSAAPRVMMVSRLFRPWIGGTERQAERLSAALVRQGRDVQLLTGRWDRRTRRHEVFDAVPVTRHTTGAHLHGIPGFGTVGGYLYVASLCWRLWRRRDSYDVIHVHGLNYHAAACVLMGQRLGKPILVKLANSGTASDLAKMREDRQLRGASRMLGTALQADRFVALTRRIADELEAAGVDPGRVVEIPNGVTVPPSRPDREERGSSPVTVVYAGRLHRQKGLDTLLGALQILQRRQPGAIRLRLVGGGPEAAALTRLAVELGIAGQVTFTGELDDVTSELQRADAFVLPSLAEGLSNALLEAMAAGLAVVASDIPGNAAVVDHGRTGLLVPAGDARALASTLEAVAADADLRDHLGARARSAVADRYGLDRIAERYGQLYDELTTEDTMLARTEVGP